MTSPASDVSTLRSTAAIRENSGATALATLPVGSPDLRKVAVSALPTITRTESAYLTLGVLDDVIAFRRRDPGGTAFEFCTTDVTSDDNWTELDTAEIPEFVAVRALYPTASIDGIEAADASTWLLWLGVGTALDPDGVTPRCWVMRTTDGGATWTQVFSGPWCMNSQGSQHSIGRHVVFGTYRGQLTQHFRATAYYSADFGATGFAEIWQDNFTGDLATIQATHPTATAYNLRHVHGARLDTSDTDYVAICLDAGSHVSYGPGSAVYLLHKPVGWTDGHWDVSVLCEESGGVVDVNGNQNFSGPQFEFISSVAGGQFYFGPFPWSRAAGWAKPLAPPYAQQATVNGGLPNIGPSNNNTHSTVGLYRGVTYRLDGAATGSFSNQLLASSDGVTFAALWRGFRISCWGMIRGALNGNLICDSYPSTATAQSNDTPVGQMFVSAVTPATVQCANVQPAVTNFLTGPSLTLVNADGKVHQYLVSGNFAAAVPVPGGGYSGGAALKFPWNSNANSAGYVDLRSGFIAAQGWPTDVAAGDRFVFTCWVRLVGVRLNNIFQIELSGMNVSGHTSYIVRQDGDWSQVAVTGVCGAGYTNEQIHVYLQLSRMSADAAHSSLPTDGTAYLLVSNPSYVRIKPGRDWRHDWDAVVGLQAADVAEFPLIATAAHHGCLRWQPHNQFDANAAGFTAASEVCVTTPLFSVWDTAGGSFVVQWNASTGLIEFYNSATAATVAATAKPISLQHLDQVVFAWANGAALTLAVFDPYNGWQACSGNTIAAIGTPYRLYSGDGTATNPGLGRYCQPVLADGSVADLQAWATAALPPSLQGVFDLAARDAATTASTQVAQAEVDKAAVAAHPDYIVVGRTILATEGTAPDLSGLAASVAALPSAAEVAAAILAAPANKLATDANGQVTAANSGGLTQQQAALLTAIGEAAGTLTVAERNAVADSLLDRAAAIDSKTVRQALCIIAAPIAGEVRGVGTERETFKGLDGVTDRVQVTVDAAGNRSSVTYP